MYGTIIDFEGIDGTGKGTQSRILYNRLLSEGYNAEYVSFPKYESFFGNMIGNYLNGNYGSLSSVPVEFATLLFALDRWQHFRDNKEIRSDSPILVVDRYVLSNVAHQSSKIPVEKRRDYISWILHLEHEVFHVPKATITLILDADPAITAEYILKKQTRLYTEKKMDIHERDQGYLSETRKIFIDMSKTHSSFHLINCTQGRELRSVNEISDEIWGIVKGFCG